MKLRPREPGDQNATTLPALVAGEIAIRQAQDGAAGAKHDDGGVGMPERLSLSAA